MSIEVKPGRWRTRGGGVAIVDKREDDCPGYPWFGTDSDGCAINWQESGRWLAWGPSIEDLVEYLGPEEPVGGAS